MRGSHKTRERLGRSTQRKDFFEASNNLLASQDEAIQQDKWQAEIGVRRWAVQHTRTHVWQESQHAIHAEFSVAHPCRSQPRELTLEEFMACFGISWVDEEEVRSASYYEFMNAFGLMPVDNTMNELAPVLDGNLFQRARRARLLQELCEAGEGMMQ